MYDINIKEELYLILGCFGRIDDNFISCSCCENRILKIDTSLYNHNEIVEYFDVCHLLEKPLFDFNAIRSVLQNLQDRFIQRVKPLWTAQQVQLYEKFLINHRLCGLYLKLSLVLEDDEYKPEIEEKIVKIEAKKKRTLIEGPKLKLKKGNRIVF